MLRSCGHGAQRAAPLHVRGEAKFEAEMGLVADAAFDGGVAFAGVDDYFLFFAFLVVDD